jgi:SAM-dependent methyltransferase
MNQPIRFDDGAAYERYMGIWSRLAGTQFLSWLTPSAHQRWLDVGCGNGAFTEMLVESCAPATVSGIDPSEAQLVHARGRPLLASADLRLGDAMALPYANASFDYAVMPLVLFFVPDPALGVAEMVRVVEPGGTVAAYAWDMPGGGFPYEIIRTEVRALGIDVPAPPSPDASRLEVMQELWHEAGLSDVQTRAITVQRSFENLDDYWATVLGAPSVGASLAALAPQQQALLRACLHQLLPSDPTGHIHCSARAHAVKGRKSGCESN